MKKVWIGMFVFICAALGICLASAYYARVHNYSSFNIAFGGMIKLQNTQEFDVEDINDINIKYHSEDIIFMQGQSNKIVIEEYFGTQRKNNKTQMDVIEGTLRIHSNPAITLYIMSFQSEKIKIYLPKDFAESITVEASSGNIKTEMKLVLNEFKAKTSSGNIKCDEIDASLIQAEASSGNITIEKAQGKREIATSSGYITIKDGKGDTKAVASSGNIKIYNASGEMIASTSSGNVTVDFVEIKGTIEAKASSGNVKLEIPKDSEFSYAGKVSSGNLKTDFDHVLSYNKKGNEAQGTYGNSTDNFIKTETKSGNTKIRFR